jgi:hypothetical protein
MAWDKEFRLARWGRLRMGSLASKRLIIQSSATKIRMKLQDRPGALQGLAAKMVEN